MIKVTIDINGMTLYSITAVRKDGERNEICEYELDNGTKIRNQNSSKLYIGAIPLAIKMLNEGMIIENRRQLEYMERISRAIKEMKQHNDEGSGDAEWDKHIETTKQLESVDWQPCPRADGRMEWLCCHGVGHGNHIHGCDGCCSRDDFPGKDKK